jgi:NADH dehydrogenase
VIALASLLQRFDFFPVTRDQLVMLMEGNTGDSSEVFRRLGIDPTRFDAAALAYLSAR